MTKKWPNTKYLMISVQKKLCIGIRVWEGFQISDSTIFHYFACGFIISIEIFEIRGNIFLTPHFLNSIFSRPLDYVKIVKESSEYRVSNFIDNPLKE